MLQHIRRKVAFALAPELRSTIQQGASITQSVVINAELGRSALGLLDESQLRELDDLFHWANRAEDLLN